MIVGSTLATIAASSLTSEFHVQIVPSRKKASAAIVASRPKSSPASLDEIAVRILAHRGELAVGKAEVRRALGRHAADLRDTHAVPYAQVRDRAAREREPWLRGTLIAVAGVACGQRDHGCLSIGIKTESRDLCIIGMRRDNQHTVARRHALAAKMQRALPLAQGNATAAQRHHARRRRWRNR